MTWYSRAMAGWGGCRSSSTGSPPGHGPSGGNRSISTGISPLQTVTLGIPKKGLCAVGGWGGGGVVRAPSRRCEGFGERGSGDRPLRSCQAKSSNDDSPPALQSGPEGVFFHKKSPVIHTSKRSMRSMRCGIMLSHICLGTLGPPLNLPPRRPGGRFPPARRGSPSREP